MIPRDASPIAHVSPRPRIDLYGPRSSNPNLGWPIMSIAELIEQERLWRLVKGAAEGSNVAAAAKPEVCSDGWEAA
jgi:hypothetical protein